jgi:hypothetical protein
MYWTLEGDVGVTTPPADVDGVGMGAPKAVALVVGMVVGIVVGKVVLVVVGLTVVVVGFTVGELDGFKVQGVSWLLAMSWICRGVKRPPYTRISSREPT